MDPNQQAANAITLVERYGSFGLLAVIVFAFIAFGGWGGWYVVTRLGPRVAAWLESKLAEHYAAGERRDAVCKEAAATSAKSAETSARAAETSVRAFDAVTALVQEVRRLADRTDDHRPLKQ